MEITGEQADGVGPEIGPAISGDFPQVIAALIALTEGERWGWWDSNPRPLLAKPDRAGLLPGWVKNGAGQGHRGLVRGCPLRPFATAANGTLVAR